MKLGQLLRTNFLAYVMLPQISGITHFILEISTSVGWLGFKKNNSA